MKKGLNAIIQILLIHNILTDYGCATTGFLMAKPQVTLFSDKYPSKDPSSIIDVYITNKPDKAYIEFAKITCKDTDDNWSLNQIKIKAREIGADGIIILGKAGSSGVGIPMGASAYVVNEDYGMIAIAIIYK